MITPQKFRAKSIVVEAMRVNGFNFPAVRGWAGDDVSRGVEGLDVSTRSGVLHARIGDWIVKHDDELTVCRPMTFNATHERVAS